MTCRRFRHISALLWMVSMFLMLTSTTLCYGQNSREVVKREIFSDTLGVKSFTKAELKSNKFYDKILHSQSKLVSWLGSLLIGARSSADDAQGIPITEFSEDYFAEFVGCKIANIYIVGANIFGQTDLDDLSWSENTLNKLHRQTREWVVQKNLMFEVGDTINPYLFSINEQYLRSKPYFATAFFLVEPNTENPLDVDIYVFARDNWSISASGGLAGAPFVDVYDRNFVGSGNMLLLRYYGNGEYQRLGVQADYRLNNMWGTFADAVIQAGVGSTNNSLALQVDKGLILPSDHIWGVDAGFIRNNVGLPILDTTMAIDDITWGGYYGRSFEVDRRKNIGLYGVASLEYKRYRQTPLVTPLLNPYYSNRVTAMVNLGVSRQQYFQGNLIYGYGRTEDIPFGFKVELNGGWEHNETLGLRWYVGALARYGNYTDFGYFDLGVKGGTYINYDGSLSQGQLDGYLNYFSPLANFNTFYLRQFLNIRYTRGFNRLSGERELLYYRDPGIYGLSTPVSTMATSRLMLSGETVFFTPIFLYHFRFAFFGWGDCGWLGNRVNIFDNQFSAAAGVGVRIKNERLIFNNVQVRFGFLLKGDPNAAFRQLQFSNERVFEPNVYTPSRPEPLIFE